MTEPGYVSPFRVFGAGERKKLEKWEAHYARLGIPTLRKHHPGRAVELLVDKNRDLGLMDSGVGRIEGRTRN